MVKLGKIRVGVIGVGNLCSAPVQGIEYCKMMWDSGLKYTCDDPNEASILIDMIRAVKLALDRGITGFLKQVSAYGFKTSMGNLTSEATNLFEEFIEGGG